MLSKVTNSLFNELASLSFGILTIFWAQHWKRFNGVSK